MKLSRLLLAVYTVTINEEHAEIIRASAKLLEEQDEEIRRLRAENERLKKRLEARTEDLQALKYEHAAILSGQQ